nr:MAG TPA: hypothetical protein [Caudoviricetes sp.]
MLLTFLIVKWYKIVVLCPANGRQTCTLCPHASKDLHCLEV